jgi:uncharacterized repeat protein (TIGR01451 family)
MVQGLLRRSVSVFATASLLELASGLFGPVFAAGSSDLFVGVSGPSTATTRQHITYNLALGTRGPDPATNVILTNTFSSPVTYLGYASGAPCSQTSPTVITCGPLMSLTPGMAPDWYITVTTDTPGTLVNSVTGTQNETDPNPANNTASWSTAVTRATNADLSVSKTAWPAGPYYVGTTFNYELFFSNAGLADATNVTITDQLPAQVQFVSAEAPCTASGNVVTCKFSNVWANTSSDGTRVTVLAVTSGTAINTVNISADQPDPNPSNNSYSLALQIQPPTADLSITKTGMPNPVVAGQKETYTITVTNNGPLTATGVVAHDAWSAASGIKGGIAFKSATTTQGSCTQSGSGISCNLGSLANGVSATITLVLQPRSKGTLSDTATVSGNEYDPNTANNSSTVLTTVG